MFPHNPISQLHEKSEMISGIKDQSLSFISSIFVFL